jgi:hypothetical protein
MDVKINERLIRWQKACLVITVILSVPGIIALFQTPSFLPTDSNNLLVVLIGLVVMWTPLILYWIGLRATSSISASILGMLQFGAGIFTILTPEYPKVASVIFLLTAIFYYLYSTRTWQVYEVFWFNETGIKTEGS